MSFNDKFLVFKGVDASVIPKEDLTSKFYTDRLIGKYAAWLKDRPGSVTELARRMSTRLNKSVTRQQVHLWVNPNPDNRVEPSLGYGALIIHVVKHMMKEEAGAPGTHYSTGPVRAEVKYNLPPVRNDDNEDESPASCEGLEWKVK